MKQVLSESIKRNN